MDTWVKSSDCPKALSTCEVDVLREEQAEPEDTAITVCKPDNKATPSTPAMLTFKFPPNRKIGCPLR